MADKTACRQDAIIFSPAIYSLGAGSAQNEGIVKHDDKPFPRIAWV